MQNVASMLTMDHRKSWEAWWCCCSAQPESHLIWSNSAAYRKFTEPKLYNDQMDLSDSLSHTNPLNISKGKRVILYPIQISPRSIQSQRLKRVAHQEATSSLKLTTHTTPKSFADGQHRLRKQVQSIAHTYSTLSINFITALSLPYHEALVSSQLNIGMSTSLSSILFERIFLRLLLQP